MDTDIIYANMDMVLISEAEPDNYPYPYFFIFSDIRLCGLGYPSFFNNMLFYHNI